MAFDFVLRLNSLVNQNAFGHSESQVTFDINQISDAGIRQEFLTLERRAHAIFNDISSSLGRDKSPITLRFVNDGTFNAYASRTHSKYQIEINAAVPLLSMMLFSKLFSDSDYFRHLESGGAIVTNFITPAIIDIRDFKKRHDWEIRLNASRATAAATMADICSTFTLCHEIGHIIAGHVDAVQNIDGGDGIQELVSISKFQNEKVERSQAWECDADAIAATLMVKFVEELARKAQNPSKTGAVFFTKRPQLFEEILASVCSALFVFFNYVDEIKKQVNAKSSHPHPILRAFYFKDLICQAMKQCTPFDYGLFSNIVDEQLEEAMTTSEKLKLFDPGAFSDVFLGQLEAERARMILLQEKYRLVASPWSWVSWN